MVPVSPPAYGEASEPIERAAGRGRQLPARGPERSELALAVGRPGHRDRGHPAGRGHDQDQQRQEHHVHEVHAGRDLQAGGHGPDLQLQRARSPASSRTGPATRSRGPSPSLPNDVQTMRNDGVQVSFPTPSSNLLATLLPYLFIIGSAPPSSTSSAARPGARCRGSCRSAAPRPRCSAATGPRPPSPTSPATPGSSRRSARSSTSSRRRAASRRSGRRSPRASCWSAPRAPARRCWPAPSPARPACRSCRSPARTSWRCSSASAPAGSATSSRPPASRRRPSSSSTRSTPSAASAAPAWAAGTTSASRPSTRCSPRWTASTPSEGVVMIAATNRPDILDPALLRPGALRPPDRGARCPTSRSGCRSSRCTARASGWRPTSTSSVVARGTPGMSGADLANLVNEAALHAVRRGSADDRHGRLRDGPRPGAARASAASPWCSRRPRRSAIAYHEGGHAVLAYVLEHADPVHKVTILPTGMALGVTQQLPMEERHIYSRQYIEDSLCVRMGGRVRRAARLRRPLDRRRQRPRRQHRAGPQDGARVGHERGDRPDGLGLARARSSWARTSCTRGTTPRTPPRSSTTRSSGSCATRRRGPWRC